MMLALLLLACKPVIVDNNGWTETAPPRADLQCWIRWSQSSATVCAPALNSTHGASMGPVQLPEDHVK